MSYDLVVFNPETAPKNKEDFKTWFDKQIDLADNRSYSDLEFINKNLESCFLEIVKSFPALNGPYSNNDIDQENMTDYDVSENIICASFPWSSSDQAYNNTKQLAEKHNVGFYDVSGNEDVFSTDDYGNFRKIQAFGKNIFTIGGETKFSEEINPKLEYIEKLIDKIDGTEISFLILEDEFGSYIQGLGNQDRLTVEFRKKEKGIHKHFVLSKKKSGLIKRRKQAIIKTSTGIVKVLKEDILNTTDLKVIFESFYNFGDVPNEYYKRDITNSLMK